MSATHGEATGLDGGDKAGGAVITIPPRSDMAERHFVGAMLWLPSATVLQAAAVVDPGWISDPQVAGVYAAVIENAKAGIRDAAAVVPTMLRLGLPSHKHGIATGLVVDLYTECQLPNNWRLYASLIGSGRVRTRLESLGYVLVEHAHRDALERLQSLLEEALREVAATQARIVTLIGGEQTA